MVLLNVILKFGGIIKGCGYAPHPSNLTTTPALADIAVYGVCCIITSRSKAVDSSNLVIPYGIRRTRHIKKVEDLKAVKIVFYQKRGG